MSSFAMQNNCSDGQDQVFECAGIRNLPTIFQFGIKERDSKAFNRVRFVIATNKFEEIKLIAENIFKNLTDKDDKIHLHLISKNEFTQF